MLKTLTVIAGCVLSLLVAPVTGQDAVKQQMQQKIAAIKQSMGESQALLRQYTWTETTEVRVKGEVKKREQNECRYGTNGKVEKTPIGASSDQTQTAGKKRGLRGKIIENKVEEMKDYLDRVGSLVRRYVPPDAAAMQAAFQSGKASINPAGSLTFTDYAKPGDSVTLTFDPVAMKMRSLKVNSYLDSLDDPKEKVTLEIRFSSLADGANFAEETLLNAAAKQIQIKTTNFGHRKDGR
ncbi:MAG: hypothetical protein SF339_14135 [Blastocatellia bacterium]|nr:hypothetical protein [Blastocatellia bacterium]